MYWTKSPGTGGSVGDEEDFIVEEVPLKKFLVKYERTSSGVAPVTGPYSLCLMKKKEMTTKEAISLLAAKLSVKKEDIGYAGLKDKHGVTTQYITIKGRISGLSEGDLQLSFVSPCSSFMSIGELEGNDFRITLRNCSSPDNAGEVVKELEKRGMPNYFGPQRFGIANDNHVVGLLLLKRSFDSALKIINNNHGKNYRSVSGIDRKILKFFIHAYQSWVFNRVLDEYSKKNNRICHENFPIAGFNTKLSNDFAGNETRKILESDGLGAGDFKISELGMTCIGGMRPAFVDVKNISYEVNKNNVKLHFGLPKGSYATVLIREVSKNGRI